jgi:hypothetical protein
LASTNLFPFVNEGVFVIYALGSGAKSAMLPAAVDTEIILLSRSFSLKGVITAPPTDF